MGKGLEIVRNLHTSSDIVPIRVIWSKLLQFTILDDISPWRKLNLLKNRWERKYKDRAVMNGSKPLIPSYSLIVLKN